MKGAPRKCVDKAVAIASTATARRPRTRHARDRGVVSFIFIYLLKHECGGSFKKIKKRMSSRLAKPFAGPQESAWEHPQVRCPRSRDCARGRLPRRSVPTGHGAGTQGHKGGGHRTDWDIRCGHRTDWHTGGGHRTDWNIRCGHKLARTGAANFSKGSCVDGMSAFVFLRSFFAPWTCNCTCSE